MNNKEKGDIKTPEEIYDSKISCTCDEAYRSRKMADPGCAYCQSYDAAIETAKEYADQFKPRSLPEDVKEFIEKEAEKWVFETNGNKWSNNDNTAGDNFGSFKEGFNLCYSTYVTPLETENVLKEREIGKIEDQCSQHIKRISELETKLENLSRQYEKLQKEVVKE